MAMAMSMHFFGYEFARSATMTLLTSSRTGFKSNAALPFALAFVCPASLAMLSIYTKVLDVAGPRAALKSTAIFCSAGLSIFALVLRSLTLSTPASSPPLPITKFLVVSLFVFREAYVQLMATQHWSFMGSVLDSSSGAKWFGPIAGASSISSAVAGYAIGPLVNRFGVYGLLVLTSVSLLASLLFAEGAYTIAERHGFNPADQHKSSKSKSKGKPSSHESLISKADSLFKRVPALKWLFIETLICQGLSTVLNVTFISKLRAVLPSDADRAAWMGKFYAYANMVSGFFQFGVIPLTIHHLKPAWVWTCLPLIMISFGVGQILKFPPTLILTAGAFMTMKTIEYSVRGVVNELLYVPLDFESRYVGKEVIGMLGYRLGKSGTSLLLSAAGYACELGLKELTFVSLGMSVLWLGSARKLTEYLPDTKIGRVSPGSKGRKH